MPGDRGEVHLHGFHGGGGVCGARGARDDTDSAAPDGAGGVRAHGLPVVGSDVGVAVADAGEAGGDARPDPDPLADHLNALHIDAYGEAIGEPAARPDVRCEACGWEGDAKELGLVKTPAGADSVQCPRCQAGDDRLVDLGYEDERTGALKARMTPAERDVWFGPPEWTAEQIAQMQAGRASIGQPPLKINRIAEPVAVIGTFRTPPAQGMRCTRCWWSGTEVDLIAHPHPRGPTAMAVCPKCQQATGLQTVMPGGAVQPFPPDPASPAAACTAHVTSAQAEINRRMSQRVAAVPATAEIHCTNCEWEGSWDMVGLRNPQDAESLECPWCSEHAGPDGCMAEGPAPDGDGPTTILDHAIRGSASIDPMGARKPEEHLRVRTFEEKEAERLRDAERIASMGRS